MTNFKAKYSGSCLCGVVRYEISQFEQHIGHCHCIMCQKFHGAAFSTFGEVKQENLRWLSGYENLKTYNAENATTRQFCATCGSSLVFCSAHNIEQGTIEIAIASLDGDHNLKPDAHIYTNYKVAWIELKDDLPKYREYRDS